MISFTFKSEFVNNILTLMTGTAFAQVIPILISPILTRLYTPEDFGVFALYSSLVMGFLTIASLRYELAIMLPKKNSIAKKIVLLSQRIAIIFTVLLSIVLLVFHERIVIFFNNTSLSLWLYFVAPNILILSLISICHHYLNRHKRYKVIAKSRVLQSSVMGSSQIFIGTVPAISGVTGIVIGSILGQLINLLFLLKKMKLDFSKEKLTTKETKGLMKEYKKMPLLNGPNAVVDSIGLNGINLLINNFFSSLSLGHFSLAWRVLHSPISLINGALSQVCYQQMSNMEREKLFSFIIGSLARSFIIGIIPFSLLYFLSPSVFTFIFGEEWKVAGAVAQLLSPWLFINLITSPVSTFFIVVQRQGTLFIFACFYMALPLLTIWFNKGSFLDSITYLSYVMSGLLIVFIIIILVISNGFMVKNEK